MAATEVLKLWTNQTLVPATWQTLVDAQKIGLQEAMNSIRSYLSGNHAAYT